MYNALCRVNTTVLKSDTWSITLLTTRFDLYIGHLQVFLKLIELLYKQYGVLNKFKENLTMANI
jgi:hypothetical protein